MQESESPNRKGGNPYINALMEYRSKSELGGGPEKIEKQHQAGKMTARERINMLFDEGSFEELDQFAHHECHDFGIADNKILGDGVITGMGKINGRLIFAFSQDFTVFGGSLSSVMARKICKVMDLALKNGAPIIGLNDSGGARIHEGVASLGGYADIFHRNVKASGVIPQISVIMGPCAGGAVYSPAITDFIFMVDQTSHMFITGPQVIKTVTGEDVTFDELGGAKTHSEKSGVVDGYFADEREALLAVRELLNYLPSNNLQTASNKPLSDADRDSKQKQQSSLDNFLPDSAQKPYDMKDVCKIIFDNNSLFPYKDDFAKNIYTAFARLNGKSVGIIANNPSQLAGVLDINASKKAARFVRFCDCFNIPIITLVDVPGFLPGSDQELGGIIRDGAKLLYAFSEATVPKMTVITRKAYGGAYDVMNSKHIGADFNFAWPNAEIAVMGPEGACNIIFRNEIKNDSDPEQKRKQLIDSYSAQFNNPYIAHQKGYIDKVITPGETRKSLINALWACESKNIATPSRKHGNIPL